VTVIIIGMLAYFIRLLGYSFVQRPEMVYPFEALEGFTMALMMTSLAVPSMTTMTPGGRTFAATLPGAEPIPFIGAPASGGVFDPLGCLNDKTVEETLMFREAELTHCRVAMMGTAGYLVQSHFAPMFDMGDAPVIRHLDIVLQDEIGMAGSAILLSAIFFSEIYRARTGWVEPEVEMRSLRESYSPGDLKFDPLGLMPKDEAGMKAMQEKELRNGRLAMIAIAGMTVQELVTGQQAF